MLVEGPDCCRNHIRTLPPSLPPCLPYFQPPSPQKESGVSKSRWTKKAVRTLHVWGATLGVARQFCAGGPPGWPGRSLWIHMGVRLAIWGTDLAKRVWELSQVGRCSRRARRARARGWGAAGDCSAATAGRARGGVPPGLRWHPRPLTRASPPGREGMCPRSGRRSLPSLRPGSRTSGDASGRFSGGTSEKPTAPCDPIERGAVGEARVPGLLRTCQRIARRPHLLLRPPAEGRARCVSALPKRRSAPFPQPLTSLFLYPSSRGLTAGPGHPRSRAPKSHFCVPTGTRGGMWERRRSFGAPFSLLLSCPQPVRSPVAKPKVPRIWRWRVFLSLKLLTFSLGLGHFCPQKYIFGVLAFPPRDWHFVMPSPSLPAREAKEGKRGVRNADASVNLFSDPEVLALLG